MHLFAAGQSLEPGFHQRRGPYVLAYTKQMYTEQKKSRLKINTRCWERALACSPFSTVILPRTPRGQGPGHTPDFVMGTSAGRPPSARSGRGPGLPHGLQPDGPSPLGRPRPETPTVPPGDAWLARGPSQANVPRQAGFRESEGRPEPGSANAPRTRDAVFAPRPRSRVGCQPGR